MIYGSGIYAILIVVIVGCGAGERGDSDFDQGGTIGELNIRLDTGSDIVVEANSEKKDELDSIEGVPCDHSGVDEYMEDEILVIEDVSTVDLLIESAELAWEYHEVDDIKCSPYYGEGECVGNFQCNYYCQEDAGCWKNDCCECRTEDCGRPCKSKLDCEGNCLKCEVYNICAEGQTGYCGPKKTNGPYDYMCGCYTYIDEGGIETYMCADPGGM